jgi:hypothetical protein
MGIHYLGYVEFALAGRFLFRGGLQRTLKAQIDLNALEKTLAAGRNAQECAGVVCEAARRFGFNVTEFQLNGENFNKPFRYSLPGWEVRIPLDSGDFVALMRDSSDDSAFTTAGPFIDILRSGLRKKVSEFNEAGMVESAAEVLVPASRYRTLRAAGE